MSRNCCCRLRASHLTHPLAVRCVLNILFFVEHKFRPCCCSILYTPTKSKDGHHTCRVCKFILNMRVYCSMLLLRRTDAYIDVSCRYQQVLSSFVLFALLYNNMSSSSSTNWFVIAIKVSIPIGLSNPTNQDRSFFRIADICIALNFVLDPYIYVLMRGKCGRWCCLLGRWLPCSRKNTEIESSIGLDLAKEEDDDVHNKLGRPRCRPVPVH